MILSDSCSDATEVRSSLSFFSFSFLPVQQLKVSIKCSYSNSGHSPSLLLFLYFYTVDYLEDAVESAIKNKTKQNKTNSAFCYAIVLQVIRIRHFLSYLVIAYLVGSKNKVDLIGQKRFFFFFFY